MVSRHPRPKFTKFGEHMCPLAKALTVPSFIALGQSVTCLNPALFWRPRGDLFGQSLPSWALIYSKAPTMKLPNFVPFWKPRRFLWRRDPHTRNKQELISRWDNERELLRSTPGSYPNSLK